MLSAAIRSSSKAHSGCGCHRFGAYNVGGALLWTFMFVGAGFFLGNLPAVKHNFTLVVLGIVVVRLPPQPLQRTHTACPRLSVNGL